jgi:hypothetical protein
MNPGNFQRDPYPHIRTRGLVTLVPLSAGCILLGLSVYAETAQTAQTSQPRSQRQPSSPLYQNLQKHSPEPAVVTLKNGTLTVEANDSDLSQILRDLSRESGMIIEGPVRDVRVFGRYGPQNPSAVLTELLAGLGYNILMVGSSSGGVPGELTLTNRTGGPSPPAPPQIARETTPEKKPDIIEQPQLGPGAIAHPPPAPSEDPQTRVQQNLLRLQQMHDAQTQQNVSH